MIMVGLGNLQKAEGECIYTLHSMRYASLTIKLGKPSEGVLWSEK